MDIDAHRTARRGDHRIGSLEDDHRVGQTRRLSRGLDLVDCAGREPGKQALELAGMGRQHAARMQLAKQRLGRIGEHAERIGVQHQRDARRACGSDTRLELIVQPRARPQHGGAGPG